MMALRRDAIGKIAWLILVLLIPVGMFCWWFWPKTQPFEFGGGRTGYYRGLGLVESDAFFVGKSYYLVNCPTDNGAYCEVRFRGTGYNDFRGYYQDGRLREEGECFVELLGFHDRPYPDFNNVRSGRYYKPDGTIGSRIEDGTGIQTYWTADGTKTWELELRRHKRVRLSWWYPNGQIMTRYTYVDGKRHGPFVSYYSSGKKKTEGAHSVGQCSGKWIRYNEDGSIKEIEDCTVKENAEPATRAVELKGSAPGNDAGQ